METITMITNPLTKRPIKVNGKVHTKLIRDGVLNGIIKDDTILYNINEHDDVNYLKEEFNKTLPMRKKAVIGRKGSKYDGKIVSRTRTPNTKEVVDYTLNTIKKHSSIDTEIEKMIMDELCFDRKNKSKPIKIKREKAVSFAMRQPVETETEYDTNTESDTEMSEDQFQNVVVQDDDTEDSEY
tara:strand:+ start:204 stop:752 length:549 start_codon:yes stop_codon:yes gene_type:complete